MPDFFGALWWVFVLAGSVYLVWKGLTGRLAKSPGGWGAVTPPKLRRWMTGEDDAPEWLRATTAISASSERSVGVTI
jgi:hypothetical protein